MCAHEYHGAFEPQITHAGHRDQQLALKKSRFLIHALLDGAHSRADQARTRLEVSSLCADAALLFGPFRRRNGPDPTVTDQPIQTFARFRHMLRLLAALILAMPGAAHAQMSQVTLLPGFMSGESTRMAGVRITLSPGWKTYWRAPQGNGIPPQFDWSGSTNVASVQVHFPAPEILESFGVRSLGYHDEVVFPVELTLKDPGQPIGLSLALAYGVCEEVCMPALANADLDIPTDMSGGDSAIRAAWATRPIDAGDAGYTGANCAIRPDGDGYSLTARLAHSGTPATPRMVVFETAAEDVWITPETARSKPGALQIDARIDYFGTGAFALDRSALRMTLIGDGRPVVMTGCRAL